MALELDIGTLSREIQRPFEELSLLFPLGPQHLGSTVHDLLAAPQLRAQCGGTIIAGGTGSAAGTVFLCNQDSTPKAAALANQVVDVLDLSTTIDGAPTGYKTQFLWETVWTSNGTNPTGGIWSIGPVVLSGSAGGAGGYTETTGFGQSPFVQVTNPTGGAGRLLSGWVDMATGTPTANGGLIMDVLYAFYVFHDAAMAANSAIRWRSKLFRRWVRA